MPAVHIDDQVLTLLKNQARPFEETTPNAVLRRLLSDWLETDPTDRDRTSQTLHLPELPASMPMMLRQILEVVSLVVTSKLSRQKATHRVAEAHGVTYQTVNAKYGTQLEMTTRDFDLLVEEDGLSSLKALLSSRFPREANAIERFFETLTVS